MTDGPTDRLQDHHGSADYSGRALQSKVRRRVTPEQRSVILYVLASHGRAPFRVVAHFAAFGAYARSTDGEFIRSAGLTRRDARRAVQSCVSLGLVERQSQPRWSSGRWPRAKRPVSTYGLTPEGSREAGEAVL